MQDWRIERLRDAVQEKFGNEFTVAVVRPLKENDIRPIGLQIIENGSHVAPVFYVDEHDFRGVDTIADGIMEAYKQQENQLNELKLKGNEYLKKPDMSKVFFAVREAKRNVELLSERPYTPLENGMVRIYFFKAMEGARIPITNNNMEYFGMDAKGLDQVALENTPKLFPASMKGIGEVMAEMMGIEELTPEMIADMAGPEFYVLSNDTKMDGAATLYYPGMLEQIRDNLGENYYVLPSSIHEQLIVRESIGIRPQELEMMVQEVNASQVNESEQLSDQVLYYDSLSKTLSKPKEVDPPSVTAEKERTLPFK